MWGTLWNFLNVHYPRVVGYFLMIGTTIFCTIKIYDFYKETKHVCDNHDEIKDKLDLLLQKKVCDKHDKMDEKLDLLLNKKVCDKHDKMGEKLDVLVNSFDNLITVLQEIGVIKNKDCFLKNSPVTLTDKGIELIKSLGWDKIVENQENKKFLFNKLDQLNLQYKADVEKHCILMIHELNGETKENSFTQVKIYLYENANVDKQSAFYACALYLRDKYLQEHLEIK